MLHRYFSTGTLFDETEEDDGQEIAKEDPQPSKPGKKPGKAAASNKVKLPSPPGIKATEYDMGRFVEQFG